MLLIYLTSILASNVFRCGGHGEEKPRGSSDQRCRLGSCPAGRGDTCITPPASCCANPIKIERAVIVRGGRLSQASRCSGGNGRRGVSGIGSGPRPGDPSQAGAMRCQAPAPGSCARFHSHLSLASGMGEPVSPDPFNQRILKAADHRQREVVGRRNSISRASTLGRCDTIVRTEVTEPVNGSR